MRIYNYSWDTGDYLGADMADPSPLEPGKWLIPGYATKDEPPTFDAATQTCRWLNGSWTVATKVIALPPEPEPNEPAVPQVVSRFQARAALHLNGILEEVDALMMSAETDAIARIAWTDAQEFYRQSPTILGIAPLLDLSDEDLDNLFIVAAGLQA